MLDMFQRIIQLRGAHTCDPVNKRPVLHDRVDVRHHGRADD